MGIFAFLLMGATLTANAAILTFDDHPDVASNSTGDILNYGGFDFSQNLDWIDAVGGWDRGSISGNFTMVNNNGGVGVITEQGSNDFTFDGLFARTWATTGNRTGYIRGFFEGSEIWTSTINITKTWTEFLVVGGAIDELRLDMGNYFLVDDLALTPAPVPLPPAVILFISALFPLFGFAKKRAAGKL